MAADRVQQGQRPDDAAKRLQASERAERLRLLALRFSLERQGRVRDSEQILVDGAESIDALADRVAALETALRDIRDYAEPRQGMHMYVETIYLMADAALEGADNCET